MYLRLMKMVTPVGSRLPNKELKTKTIEKRKKEERKDKKLNNKQIKTVVAKL